MRKKYLAMDCPICGEFYFAPLTKDEKRHGETGLDSFCYVCGWKYSLEDLRNIEKINLLKNKFKEKRKLNKNYNYIQAIAPKKTRHLCPVCKRHIFDDINSFDICPICGWEDDQYGVIYPDSDGGANEISLNDSIKIYNSKKNNK